MIDMILRRTVSSPVYNLYLAVIWHPAHWHPWQNGMVSNNGATHVRKGSRGWEISTCEKPLNLYEKFVVSMLVKKWKRSYKKRQFFAQCHKSIWDQ